MDGWHRCAAAERAGLAQLPAVLRPIERRETIYVEAAARSAVSSQPLTRFEKRAAVDRLLTLLDPARYSDRALARLVGVSQPFVGQRRRLMLAHRNEFHGPAKPGANAEARPHPPSPHPEAQKLVAAATALLRLQHATTSDQGGCPFHPGMELLAAALHSRSCDLPVLLAALESWILEARTMHTAPAIRPDPIASNST